MQTLVMKFGGTSVGNAGAIQQTAAICVEQKKSSENLVVVVSAMSGITDLLIKAAQQAAANQTEEMLETIELIRSKHLQAIRDLIPAETPRVAERESVLAAINSRLNDLANYCHSIQVLGEVTSRGMDVISSLGERMSAQILAALLRVMGTPALAVEATELIVTDRSFQSANPQMAASREKSRKVLLPLFHQGFVPVVTGFMAATPEGIITTLGRGGSDYTGAILADCLDADELWIWSDVDGILTADPRVVEHARTIPEISFAKVSELAYFGAKVLHPKTIRPAIARNMPLWVKNTFNPTFPGTRISQSAEGSQADISAVTTIKDLSILTVEGRGMLGVPGIAARTFSAVARTGASVQMISQSSSEQSICFTIPSRLSADVVASLEAEMTLELYRKDIDRIWSRDKVVIVSIIGGGLRDTPGISARIFGALGKANINVLAIAQGSSEYSLSLLIDEADARLAVCAIHDELIPPLA
jgi:aspartate kinase